MRRAAPGPEQVADREHDQREPARDEGAWCRRERPPDMGTDSPPMNKKPSSAPTTSAMAAINDPLVRMLVSVAGDVHVQARQPRSFR